MIEAKVIDGKKIASAILEELKLAISKAAKKPKLAIILMGEMPASIIYVKTKVKQAHSIGMETILLEFTSFVDEQEVLDAIFQLNQDATVDGIIVQMPVPKHINFQKLVEKIDPKKDVDGLHPVNIGKLWLAQDEACLGFVPCTALGCLKAISSCLPDLSGKNIAIVNRSNLVGKPLMALLLKQNATVTICHSLSANLHKITSKADIVICAIGKAKYFTKNYFKKGATIIDVGIARQSGTALISGDVDFENVKDHVSYITPVPGGIGPLTVAYLLSNTYNASLRII